jgi:hypothetical protein
MKRVIIENSTLMIRFILSLVAIYTVYGQAEDDMPTKVHL